VRPCFRVRSDHYQRREENFNEPLCIKNAGVVRVAFRSKMLVLCVLLFSVPKASSAALILQAESVTTTSPGTGFFDVFAVIDDTVPRGIAAYNVRLDLSPTTFSASLDSAETALIQPLFAGQDPLEFATGNFLRVADDLPGINLDTPLVNGSRLFRVLYSVPAGVLPGTVIDVNFNSLETALFDGTAAESVIDGFFSGSITVSAFSAGDFDTDFDVDGADFLQWQRGGSPNPLSSSDLTNWGKNFGNSANLPSIAHAIPEPATGVLLVLAGILGVCRRI